MSEPSHNFPAFISRLRDIGLILHIGAGECSELSEYLNSTANNILLFEPHPTTSLELRRQTDHYRKIEVIPCAVVGEEHNKTVTFKLTNHRALSNLQGINNELKKLFPELKIVDERHVAIKSLETILCGLSINHTVPNILVLDALDENTNLLRWLLDNSYNDFSHIIVYDGHGGGSVTLYTDKQSERFCELGYLTQMFVRKDLAAKGVLLYHEPDTRYRNLKREYDAALQEIKYLKKSLKENEPFRALNELDKKMLKYINYENGFYIEIGASDGVNQSNTHYYEKELNWDGVLIEPILQRYFDCRKNRVSTNSIYCCACVSFEYEKDYVSLNYSNLMTTPRDLESDIKDPLKQALLGERHLQHEEHSVPFMAPARTMTSILDESGAPNVIDFLSLDVEGAEIEVLKGIDFERYKFKYILVECRDKSKMDKYMEPIGYSFVEALSHHDFLYSDTNYASNHA